MYMPLAPLVFLQPHGKPDNRFHEVASITKAVFFIINGNAKAHYN